MEGINAATANSYCNLEDECNWHFSIASSWGIFVLHYVVFSLVGIYLDNVMPNALGACKKPWYFLEARYWGLGDATWRDTVDEITDEVWRNVSCR